MPSLANKGRRFFFFVFFSPERQSMACKDKMSPLSLSLSQIIAEQIPKESGGQGPEKNKQKTNTHTKKCCPPFRSAPKNSGQTGETLANEQGLKMSEKGRKRHIK